MIELRSRSPMFDRHVAICFPRGCSQSKHPISSTVLSLSLSMKVDKGTLNKDKVISFILKFGVILLVRQDALNMLVLQVFPYPKKSV